MSYLELPKPWEEVEILPSEQQQALEAVVGCGLSLDDMTDGDMAGDSQLREPRSLRAKWALNHRWVRLRNKDTGDEMVIRLQLKGSDAREVYVSAVISPFHNGEETTGSQLRALPVSAISAAYTAQEMGATILLNRTLMLGGGRSDWKPTDPLPRGRVTDQSFLARVGEQYDAFAGQYPDDDPVNHMMEVNGAALSTVKKWLTAARKAMMLMPVAAGRKRG